MFYASVKYNFMTNINAKVNSLINTLCIEKDDA